MGNTFTKSNIASDARRGARKALGVAAALALLGGSVAALADPPVTMAPPVDGGGGYPSGDNQSYDNGPAYDNAGNDAQVTNVADATRDTVFNWQEVPQGQQVPVRRAVFDQGGYQIYDSVGETIVVPFTNHNLYAMKFAVSPDGSTYFENTGADPVLYVPRGGFLENAAVPGARWYPFSENFHPATPVFLGIAPSWDDYCAMGWYPHMVFYGGYWGRHPYYPGALSLSLFAPSFGLSISLGGRHYDGWEPYHRFYEGHPAPYHVTVVNNNYYRFGGHPDFNRGGGFRGGHPDFAGRGLGGDHNFGGVNGGQRVFNGGQRVGGPHDFARERNVGGGRVFNGGGQTVYAHRNIPGDRSFGGIRPDGANAVHTFGSNTNRTFGGGHTFQGAGPSVAGRTFGGGQNSGGDRGFGGNSGGHPFGATRPMPGVEARPASGGGHSFGGGRLAGGGAQPASHGGDRSAARPSTDNGGHGGGNHDGGDHGDRR